MSPIESLSGHTAAPTEFTPERLAEKAAELAARADLKRVEARHTTHAPTDDVVHLRKPFEGARELTPEEASDTLRRVTQAAPETIATAHQGLDAERVLRLLEPLP